MYKETWKIISGFENRYEVSSLGRVRSIANRHGNTMTPHFLSPGKTSRGYLKVSLFKNGRRVQCLVHRLVLQTFSKTIGKQVNHKNGRKNDNVISNLEWCSCSENHAHARKTGLIKSMRGVLNLDAKLNETKVLLIREELSMGCTQVSIAERFGVSQPTVSSIKLRKTWDHIP